MTKYYRCMFCGRYTTDPTEICPCGFVAYYEVREMPEEETEQPPEKPAPEPATQRGRTTKNAGV